MSTAGNRNRTLRPRLDRPLSVKVIGLGGVGGIVARYASLFLASLDGDARLVLIDGDSFEASNAARMFFPHPGNKAEVVRDDLVKLLGDSPLMLGAVPEYIGPDNLGRLVREQDIVLLAVDNHATRKLVGDFCAGGRENVCLISGGNDGVGVDGSGRELRGTYGNCQIHVRRQGRDLTPALTRFHPEIASPGDHLPSDTGCAELVASVPQILFTNLTVAAALLNTFWLYLCEASHYAELCLDIGEGLMRPVPLPDAGLPTVAEDPAPAAGPAH